MPTEDNGYGLTPIEDGLNDMPVADEELDTAAGGALGGPDGVANSDNILVERYREQ